MTTETVDRVSVQVAATPETLWDMVSDIKRMGEWSPETYRTFWLGWKRRPEVGVRFVGVNKDGRMRWPTTSRIVEAERGRVFAFRTFDSGVTWRYRFEPAEGGTRVTEERDATRERTPLIRIFYKTMGGYDRRIGVIRDGMRQTLERLKAAAEA
jgi:uncharacterized protein YndB with AHSA1/START domain